MALAPRPGARAHTHTRAHTHSLTLTPRSDTASPLAPPVRPGSLPPAGPACALGWKHVGGGGGRRGSGGVSGRPGVQEQRGSRAHPQPRSASSAAAASSFPSSWLHSPFQSPRSRSLPVRAAPAAAPPLQPRALAGAPARAGALAGSQLRAAAAAAHDQEAAAPTGRRWRRQPGPPLPLLPRPGTRTPLPPGGRPSVSQAWHHRAQGPGPVAGSVPARPAAEIPGRPASAQRPPARGAEAR